MLGLTASSPHQAGPAGPKRKAVLHEQAWAKVNLFLAVGPRRSDGYHDLLTVFESLPSPHDDVTVAVGPAPEKAWVFRAQAAAPPGLPVPQLPRDLDNLAGRAAERFVAAVAASRPGWLRPSTIEITITKRIPVAAGMGGGSSDAAAVLRALQARYGNPLDRGRLSRLAAELGSDVPFFLEGGRAVGRCRGENLSPLPDRPRLPVVLGLPSFPLRTPDVYREFDRLAAAVPAERGWGAGLAGGPPGGLTQHPAGPSAAWERREDDLAALVTALASGHLPAIAACLRNDLQPAAVSLRPEIGRALDVLRQAGCLTALVSGSGPAVFGLAPGEAEAARIAAAAEASLPPDLGGKITFVPVVSGRP